MKTVFPYLFVALLGLFSSPLLLAQDNQQQRAVVEVAQLHSPININTADVEALASLKGIGTKKAEAIIAWREKNGGFTSVEQLLEVKGIGAAILDANRESLQVK